MTAPDPWDEAAFVTATRYGTIENMKWLMANECAWTSGTSDSAARNGSLEVNESHNETEKSVVLSCVTPSNDPPFFNRDFGMKKPWTVIVSGASKIENTRFVDKLISSWRSLWSDTNETVIRDVSQADHLQKFYDQCLARRQESPKDQKHHPDTLACCLVIDGADFTDVNTPDVLLQLLRDSHLFCLTVFLTSTDPAALPEWFFLHTDAICFLDSDRITVSRCAYYMRETFHSLEDSSLVQIDNQLVAYYSEHHSADHYVMLSFAEGGMQREVEVNDGLVAYYSYSVPLHAEHYVAPSVGEAESRPSFTSLNAPEETPSILTAPDTIERASSAIATTTPPSLKEEAVDSAAALFEKLAV